MNLALPALVLLYLALPGFLVVKASRGRLVHSSSESSEPVVNLSAMTVGFVMALLLAPALHFLWVYLAELATPYEADIATTAYLLAGNYEDPKRLDEAVAAAISHPAQVLLYFTSLCGFAVLVGRSFHLLVLRFHLDRTIPVLRFNNDWYYLFSGPLVEDKYEQGTRVAATVRQGEKVYVYTGLLDSYAIAGGKLDRIVLIEPVYRRLLTSDPWLGDEGTEPEDSERYYKIAGDRFVLWARDITTLNVDYLYLVPVGESGGDDLPTSADDPANTPSAPDHPHADRRHGDLAPTDGLRASRDWERP